MRRHQFSRFVSVQGLAALLLGLLTTAILVVSISLLEYNKISLEFERRAGARIAAVRGGVQETASVLSTVNRLFETAGPVSRVQFHAFTQPILERYPHIHSLAFQRVVPDQERAQFEAAMRKSFPDFHITELVNGREEPSRQKESYRVIDYLEPMASNKAAFGFDAGSGKEQADAARRACETGQVWATNLYGLIQDSGTQRGFAMLMPVYRPGRVPEDPASRCSSVVGYTAAVLRGADLVELPLAARGLRNSAAFNISVYADGFANEGQLFFRIGAAPSSGSSHPVLFKWFTGWPDPVSETFSIAGRQWHSVVSPASAPPWTAHLGSRLTLVVGILGSIFAAIYMHAIATRSREVRRLVVKRTSELSAANQTLKLREQAIEACVNAIFITSAEDPDYPIEYVNRAFEKMTGYSRAEIIGKSCSVLWGQDIEQSGVRDVIKSLRERRETKATLRTYRKDAQLFWSELYIAPVDDQSGRINHFVMAQYDITENKQYEAELEYRASHDALTGLANRKLLQERLEHAVAGAARYGHSVWVVLIDIDRFKFVNDSFGHHAGDMVLKALAARLQSAVRESDTVARGGGDEFVLLLPHQPTQQRDIAVVQRLMGVIAEPLEIEGRQVFLTCSMGVAIYSADGENANTLIQNADLAMYRAQELGRGSFQFYTQEMNERVREHMKIECGLREALERGEFMLHYQPQVDLCTGQVVGMEALLRSSHPELAMIAPTRLVEIAEETALIVPIGEWVLRTACAQAKAWQVQGLGNLRVAVNLSVRQFVLPGLADLVAGVLEETGLPGSLLDIELTERLVMTDVEHAIDVLGTLRALGIHLSIDDFGTGYSSLAHLKRFPIDTLKIDQSFVREISPHSNDAAISDAIISMAHSLGMRVIAEGVETEAQCEFLSRNMCDEIQGFLFSKPLPADEIGALLREGRCLPEHLRRLQKRPRTLLLVDDEPNILAALKRLMRPAGYQILTAGSGQEGLEILSRHEADVIVSDQRMPGMTGVEFLRTVKTLHPETVRIVLSGFTELQSVTDAVNEGAIYKFLTKPWDDAQLREHVEKAFQHKQMLDENRRLDLEVRTANLELAKANRQLEEVLKQKQRKMQRDEITLDIVREALHHVPLPILGLDEDEVIAFANLAAQELFKGAGMILGGEAAQLMPEVLHALRDAGDGEKRSAEFGGMRMEVVSRSMGKGTQSRGLLVKFKLFTVPGQVAHDGTRKAVLSRADGVVFVADSQRNQAINNGVSFENLMANTSTLGIDAATLPLVVQFNKRDLPDILSEGEVLERWSGAPWPLFFASALEGSGVLPSFFALLERVYDRLDERFSLASAHGLSRAAFVAAAGGKS